MHAQPGEHAGLPPPSTHPVITLPAWKRQQGRKNKTPGQTQLVPSGPKFRFLPPGRSHPRPHPLKGPEARQGARTSHLSRAHAAHATHTEMSAPASQSLSNTPVSSQQRQQHLQRGYLKGKLLPFCSAQQPQSPESRGGLFVGDYRSIIPPLHGSLPAERQPWSASRPCLSPDKSVVVAVIHLGL